MNPLKEKGPKVTSICVKAGRKNKNETPCFYFSCHFNVRLEQVATQHWRAHREMHAFASKTPLLKHLNFT